MPAVAVDNKSKRKKEPNLYELIKKQALINSDNYLLSIDEVKTQLRMSRLKLINSYIKTNKIPVTVLEDGKIMVRTLDLKLYLETKQKVYKGA